MDTFKMEFSQKAELMQCLNDFWILEIHMIFEYRKWISDIRK